MELRPDAGANKRERSIMSEGDPKGGRAVFRHHDFCAFVICRFLWTLGLQVQNVAIAWLVYLVTKDTLALGLIGLCAFIPTVPLSLVTGPAADRYDRRRIIVISCVVIVACGLTMLSLVLGGALAPGRMLPIYLTVVVFTDSLQRLKYRP